MTSIVGSLREVSPDYDALFCDVWGCVHDGVRAFPEAVAALRDFRADGGVVILITNSPRPRDAVERQLGRVGVPEDAWDAVATSGDSARAAMFHGIVGRRVHHVGPAQDEPFFEPMEVVEDTGIERVPLDEAEGLVVTGPLSDTDAAADYRPLFLAAKQRGLKLLCANPDLVVDIGDRRVICAGAMAAEYASMGGESLYFGKPHPPIYDLARRRMAGIRDVEEERILCVGDGVGTDVAGALQEGLDAMLVTGGLPALETGTPPGGQPDPSRLEAFLTEARVAVPYAIGFLR
jgi:HAD superfamily hydrolase (TIGR01459 family)